ncbi:hypothetical protein LT493_02495 [Streptomyces tricolor]|nr:hypothetical protein [Streptomyces tricolor]
MAARAAGTPVPAGGYEANPVLSAPDLVAEDRAAARCRYGRRRAPPPAVRAGPAHGPQRPPLERLDGRPAQGGADGAGGGGGRWRPGGGPGPDARPSPTTPGRPSMHPICRWRPGS